MNVTNVSHGSRWHLVQIWSISKSNLPDIEIAGLLFFVVVGKVLIRCAKRVEISVEFLAFKKFLRVLEKFVKLYKNWPFSKSSWKNP